MATGYLDIADMTRTDQRQVSDEQEDVSERFSFCFQNIFCSSGEAFWKMLFMLVLYKYIMMLLTITSRGQGLSCH